jgi:hypothetical protein
MYKVKLTDASFFNALTTASKLKYGHQHHNVRRFPYSQTRKAKTVELG